RPMPDILPPTANPCGWLRARVPGRAGAGVPFAPARYSAPAPPAGPLAVSLAVSLAAAGAAGAVSAVSRSLSPSPLVTVLIMPNGGGLPAGRAADHNAFLAPDVRRRPAGGFPGARQVSRTPALSRLI